MAQLPFPVTLSLDPLVQFWERQTPSYLSPQVEAIHTYLDEHNELRGALADSSVLASHSEFLEMLMLPVFPSAFAEWETAAALVPFEYRSIYSTPEFKRLFTQETGTLSGHVNLDLRTFTYGKLLSAYLHIFRSIYKIDVPFEYPVIFTTRDPSTGLDRHFKIRSDLRFVQIRAREDVPHISDQTRRRLLSNFTDLSEWIDLIPPHGFEFYGFSLLRAYDVTDEQVIGLLERDLIAEESLVGRTRLPDVEDHVRTLLAMPEVELGLSTIDGDDFYLLTEPSQPLADTFFARSTRHDMSALKGSAFERALERRTLQTVEDLDAVDDRSPIEDELYRWGVRCLIAAPLYLRADRIGVLYLWSPEPHALNALNVMKLVEVLPIFSAAVKRVRDEMRNRVQNVIMGRYTAIHPSVEWRFRQAAMNIIQRQEQGGSPDVEPIVFENVYPLYAATDIRSSSEHRNEAVQRDLLEHLDLAAELLTAARDERPLAIFYHLLARIERYKKSLRGSLTSGSEVAAREFLQTDLEPILLSLRDLSAQLKEYVDRYQKAADLTEGTLYRRTRAYEQSVSTLNDVISEHLDAEQTKIQKAIPHYFEKRQTDGVDFSIYVGASLRAEGEFNPADVRALRLWHLAVMCGIAAKVQRLKPQLDVALDATQLMIVQNAPINIRYRFDETRFDVDGPHHVRFEIMKHRVEKAEVKGSRERLTQPGRIAIVYSQEREASEYLGYVAYLQKKGLVGPDVENVELEDLQGMIGLRALRVPVGVESPDQLPEIDPEELYEAVEDVI